MGLQACETRAQPLRLVWVLRRFFRGSGRSFLTATFSVTSPANMSHSPIYVAERKREPPQQHEQLLTATQELSTDN